MEWQLLSSRWILKIIVVERRQPRDNNYLEIERDTREEWKLGEKNQETPKVSSDFFSPNFHDSRVSSSISFKIHRRESKIGIPLGYNTTREKLLCNYFVAVSLFS